MSNFICPTCGFNNIDCGKDGYKTAREIELEKKLDIAVKALEKLQRRKCINCKCGENCSLREYSKKGKGCSTCVSGLAQETLAKMKEIEGCTCSEKA